MELGGMGWSGLVASLAGCKTLRRGCCLLPPTATLLLSRDRTVLQASVQGTRYYMQCKVSGRNGYNMKMNSEYHLRLSNVI
jgi:hypothetical protein